MELKEAEDNINAICWYRPTQMPALEPLQVRILSTSPDEEGGVTVTPELDIAKSVGLGDVFTVLAEELHFEKSAFDPF